MGWTIYVRRQNTREVLAITCGIDGEQNSSNRARESSLALQDIKQAWCTNHNICICNCGILDSSVKLGYLLHRGQCQPGTINIQGQGSGKERIQRSSVHCSHAASYPSAWRSGRQGGTPRDVGLPPKYSSQSVLLYNLHPANTVPTKAEERKRKSSAVQSISTPELFLCSNLRKRMDSSLYSFRRASCPS